MILIFGTQAAATDAVATISSNMRLTGSTFLFDLPRELADGRWCILRPTDDDWLAGVSGYTEATGTGLVPIGEGGMAPTWVGCLALRKRFTDEEMGGVTLAASAGLEQGDPRLQMLIDTMGAAIELNMADPEVQKGIGELVQFGLLTKERADAILAPIGLQATN